MRAAKGKQWAAFEGRGGPRQIKAENYATRERWHKVRNLVDRLDFHIERATTPRRVWMLVRRRDTVLPYWRAYRPWTT